MVGTVWSQRSAASGVQMCARNRSSRQFALFATCRKVKQTLVKQKESRCQSCRAVLMYIRVQKQSPKLHADWRFRRVAESSDSYTFYILHNLPVYGFPILSPMISKSFRTGSCSLKERRFYYSKNRKVDYGETRCVRASDCAPKPAELDSRRQSRT